MTSQADVASAVNKDPSQIQPAASTLKTPPPLAGGPSAVSNVDITTNLSDFHHFPTPPTSPTKSPGELRPGTDSARGQSRNDLRENDGKSSPVSKTNLTPLPSESEFSEDIPGPEAMVVEGITGPSSQYVVIISSDFHEFLIRREVAYMSPTIKRILDSRVKEMKPWNVCEVLVNYPSLVVSKAMDYLVFREYYERTHEDSPPFTVDPAIVLEVLMASQFLDI